MVRKNMKLTKGVHVDTLFTIECNSSFIYAVERSIGCAPSESKPPKKSLASQN
jgi:hypothetical protein